MAHLLFGVDGASLRALAVWNLTVYSSKAEGTMAALAVALKEDFGEQDKGQNDWQVGRLRGWYRGDWEFWSWGGWGCLDGLHGDDPAIGVLRDECRVHFAGGSSLRVSNSFCRTAEQPPV